jgi:competence protein ComEC
MFGKGSYQFPFSRYPAVRIAVLLIAGVLLGEAFSGGFFLPLVLFLSGCVTLWGIKKVNVLSLNVTLTRFSTLLYLLLIVLFGWFRISISENSTKNITEDWLNTYEWETVEATAVIINSSFNSQGKTRCDAKIIFTRNDSLVSEENYNARILFDEPTRFANGDTIHVEATIIPISEKRNPHQFDYKSYLSNRDIYIQLKVEQILSVSPLTSKLNWAWWQNKAGEKIDTFYAKHTAPLAKALLLGFKQDLERDTRQAFARAGLSHIMAVSGLHVGFIVAPLWFLIPTIRQWKYGKLLGVFLLGTTLFLYAGITGFTVSVLRASVTAVFLTIGKLYNKSSRSINLTAAAAVFILVYDPTELFSIGFQLSFSAVFIILLVLPVLQFWLPNWLRIKWYAKPLMVVIVSIVVQIGLYPLQVYYFGEVSIISPIANALFVPWLGALVPFAILGLLLSGFVDVLGYWLSIPFDAFLSGVHQFVLFVSAQEWAWYETQLATLLIFPFWVVFIFTFASWRIPELKWKLAVITLSLGCMVQLSMFFSTTKKGELTVTYFDVGQGDAALIQTPNGKTILIDAGVWSPGFNSGKSLIIPHLQAEGITKLDAVVLSHPHADHIGGILDIMETIAIDTIYNSGFEYESNLYHNYLQRASELSIPVKAVTAGDRLFVDPSILALVLAPEGGRFNSDPNQHSVVLEIVYGDTEFLFTGDAGEDQEERILENYGTILNTDILKVGHHGSKTSSGLAFMSATTPEIAITSLAEQNKFRHPHAEAVLRIAQFSDSLLFTSRDKAIILKSDGKRIRKIDWN